MTQFLNLCNTQFMRPQYSDSICFSHCHSEGLCIYLILILVLDIKSMDSNNNNDDDVHILQFSRFGYIVTVSVCFTLRCTGCEQPKCRFIIG